MGIFKKDQAKKEEEDATKPLQAEEAQEDISLNIQTEDATGAAEKIDDRSAYNCPDCKGEGLIFEGRHGKFCQTCHGTGKINYI